MAERHDAEKMGYETYDLRIGPVLIATGAILAVAVLSFISISQVNFGRAVEEKKQGKTTFEVSNQGLGDLIISEISILHSAYDISPTQATIKPGKKQGFEVLFSPIEIGDYTTQLVMFSNDPIEPRIELPVRAFAPENSQPKLSYRPQSHNYQTVLIDSVSQIQIKLKNQGKSNLIVDNISPQDALVDTIFFVNTKNLVIAPQDSVFLTVFFHPLDTLIYADSLRFKTNDPDQKEVAISIKGRGLLPPQPHIVVSAEHVRFGNVIFGEKATATFVIQNKGEGTLHLDTLTASNPILILNPKNQALEFEEDYKVTLMYTPVKLDSLSAWVDISSNDPDRPTIRVFLSANVLINPKIEIPGPVVLDVNPKVGNQAQKLREGIRPGQLVTIQTFAHNFPLVMGYGMRLIFDHEAVAYENDAFLVGNLIPDAVALTQDNGIYLEIGVASLSETMGSGSDFLGSTKLRILDGFTDSTTIRLTQVGLSSLDGIINYETTNVIVKLTADGTPPVTGDFDADGEVGFSDFILFASGFGTDDLLFDLTGDEQVNFGDFLILAQMFGTNK